MTKTKTIILLLMASLVSFCVGISLQSDNIDKVNALLHEKIISGEIECIIKDDVTYCVTVNL